MVVKRFIDTIVKSRLPNPLSTTVTDACSLVLPNFVVVGDARCFEKSLRLNRFNTTALCLTTQQLGSNCARQRKATLCGIVHTAKHILRSLQFTLLRLLCVQVCLHIRVCLSTVIKPMLKTKRSEVPHFYLHRHCGAGIEILLATDRIEPSSSGVAC